MAQFETRWELALGAPVAALDGPFGHLQRVILSPPLRCVVALVVRYRWLPPHDIVVPVEQVAAATDAGVALAASRAELAHQPVFDAAHYLELTPSGAGAAVLRATQLGALTRATHHGRLAGLTTVLRRGEPAWSSDGRIGRVSRLLLTSSGELRQLVIHQQRSHRREVIVPIAWVHHLDARGVWIAAERAALDELPIYRSDRLIAADVAQALWDDEVVRSLDYADIDSSVCAGVVTLRGYAATPVSRARAERAARTVPGVLAVVNQIVIDGAVAGAVAQALASDARTRGENLFVQARHGVVSLRGAVGSADVSATAEACAAGVPQVRGIINAVLAPGVTITAGDLRVVQPAIGQEVYADMRIGRVAQVIIDPRLRRVTAIVVHSQLPDQATPQLRPDELTRHERLVIIPIDAVADVTDSAVLLNISGSAAAQYQELDPAHFMVPAADWLPPYPYCTADVLIGRPVETTESVSRTASSLRYAGASGVHDTPSWQQLSRGMPVQFRDQNVGTIEHIWVDSYHGGIGQIVVRLAASPHSEITVPLDQVSIVADLGAFANVDAAPLELLPAAPQARASDIVVHAERVGGEARSRSIER